jgi:hypothetical protein
MSFTYDDALVSDLYKDAYGFRPSFGYLQYWKEASPEGKQYIWDELLAELANSIEREKQEEIYCLDKFEKLIAQTISYGAGDRETALRWLTSSENFAHSQSVEGWVWEQGILFTETGRLLVKHLCSVYGISHF